MSAASISAPRSELATALLSCRSAIAGIGLISGVTNMLALTGAFFMLQVYDRVLTSRSLPTLAGMFVLVLALYIFQGLLEAIRSRVLVRIGGALNEALGERIHDVILQLPLKVRASGDSLYVLRDFDQIRAYLSGLGPTAFFDLPWMPLYLGICFAFHFWIGIAATAGAAILISLTLATELLTRAPAKAAVTAAAARNRLMEAARNNVEVIQAMGLGRRVGERWSSANSAFLNAQGATSDIAGDLGAASKILRMLLQSGILAIGAWLVIRQEASAGIIIAGSIMMSRALAPVDLAIANWKSFVGARQSWFRLNDALRNLPIGATPMQLPPPCNYIRVENLSVSPPGERRIVVSDVSFSLSAGQGLGIVGRSASGKSSLVRALVGVWVPSRGQVRLDNSSLDQWSPESLGPHVGYMPQSVELFAGTIGENISRFETDPEPTEIIAAATAADVDGMIRRLPDGYDTEIGDGGTSLSAGQRQRVALARALYRNPFLVVLDEPNSNLDAEGEAALSNAILGVRKRGGVAIVVAHRPSALSSVDRVMVMDSGRVQAFGPRNEILNKLLQRSPEKV